VSQLPVGGDSSACQFLILVVEDDASVSRLLKALLTARGYRVMVAESLAEARQTLVDETPHLIILDRNLPDGDGLSLLRELKATDGALRQYVVMLTSVATNEAKLEGFDGGVDDYVTKPFAVDELLARVRAGLRIVDLQRALIASNQRLELISTTDAVTGVRNRSWFDEELARAFSHAARYSRPLSLAVVDVDHFKGVNDRLGHPAGDAALRHVAARIAETLRKSDSLARIGGEEFAIILPETPLFDGLQVAEKIRAAVEGGGFEWDSKIVPLSASVGLASVPYSRVDRGEYLLAAADAALYRAKGRGRNRVEMERRTDPWRRSATTDRSLSALG
jgi:two-component system cell cycle response regulator